MEDPITADDPTRGGDEAEEREAQTYAAALLQQPVFVREGGERRDGGSAPLRPSVLIVAEGPAAAMLAEECLPTKRVIGRLELPAIPSPEGALRRGEFAAHTATVFQLQTEQDPPDAEAPLLVVAAAPVLPERAAAWARALFAVIPRPAATLVMSAMPAQQYCGGGSAADDVLLFSVATSAAHEGRSAAAAAPPLPPGNLLSGVPAAVISHCQVRQMAATALVGVQMAPVPDQQYLHGLAAAIGRQLQLSAHPGDGGNGSGVPASGLWQADKPAVRAACIRADRAYRSASTSYLYT